MKFYIPIALTTLLIGCSDEKIEQHIDYAIEKSEEKQQELRDQDRLRNEILDQMQAAKKKQAEDKAAGKKYPDITERKFNPPYRERD